tara:strand:- start:627 stop:1877 length:1251 start_codon:yes stop_codon:yes gene_type:complete
MSKKSISLFSCSGFGDLGLHSAGFETLCACEIIPERANLMQQNFPDTNVMIGDIWSMQDEIVRYTQSRLVPGQSLDLLLASPPCQSFSSNGMGRMSAAIKKGTRNSSDPRSCLIIPAINVCERLLPRVIIIENVPNMRYGFIMNEFEESENILDLIYRRLPQYTFRSQVVNVADYGVPQVRKRLITIGILDNLTSVERVADFYTDKNSPFHPAPMYGPSTDQSHVTLRQCIHHLPELDAQSKLQDEEDIFHRIPSWNDVQYFCMSETPENNTAFCNSKCVQCGHITENLSRVSCDECSAFLPRPMIKKEDGWRIIKAFKTSYRRMSWDRPSNALTTNSGVISSDVKGHPEQHRVLSLREIMIVSSVCGYPGMTPNWTYKFPPNKDKLIREVLGECIPPLLTYTIVKNVWDNILLGQ